MKFIRTMNHAGLRERVPVIAFWFSCIFWLFAYGVAIGAFHWFPYKIIDYAHDGAVELRNILTGKAEELRWQYRRTDRTQSVIVHRPNAFSEGLTLISGLTKEGNMEVKVITREGGVLNRWHIDWFDGFWSDPHHIPKEHIPRAPPDVHIHGIALLQNGDLVFNLENLGLVRMDLCGKVVWRLPHQTDHAVHVDETGNIWVTGQKWIEEGSPDLPNYRPPFVEYTVLKVTPGG